MNAFEVFTQNNGDVTKAYYVEMNGKGAAGQIAVALFRAQKRSTAAKNYRGRRYRQSAYDVKNWSMSEVCRLLSAHASELGITWGWQRDPSTPGFEWVLYVDLPDHGQCSFHSPSRLQGPDYLGTWSGLHNSAEVILGFCEAVRP